MQPRTRVSFVAIPAVALMLFAPLAVVGEPEALAPSQVPSFGRLNPEAPPETAQFDFFIGEWECTMKTMRPDGQGYGERKASWTAYYILDGWAIQDEWVSTAGQGGSGFGTNIRSFNPKTRKWDNRWLSSGSLQWKYFESEMVGDTMVMTGEGVDPRGVFVDRNTFYDIEKDSWKWRKDRSYDGGESWIEGIALIDAKRVR